MVLLGKIQFFLFSTLLFFACSNEKQATFVNVDLSFSKEGGLRLNGITVLSYNINFSNCSNPDYNPTGVNSSPVSLGEGSTGCQVTVTSITIDEGSADRTFTGNTALGALDATATLTSNPSGDTVEIKVVDYEISEGGGVAAADKIVIAVHELNEDNTTLGSDP